MTKGEFYQKYKRWATRCHSAAMRYEIDNAVQLLSYSAGQTTETVSDVAVRAIAVHTNHVHVLIFAVRTTWALDEDGEPEELLCEDYKLIIGF